MSSRLQHCPVKFRAAHTLLSTHSEAVSFRLIDGVVTGMPDIVGLVAATGERVFVGLAGASVGPLVSAAPGFLLGADVLGGVDGFSVGAGEVLIGATDGAGEVVLTGATDAFPVGAGDVWTGDADGAGGIAGEADGSPITTTESMGDKVGAAS
jgi:hypothetical protein